MSIKQYVTKKGVFWTFTEHIGMDPVTGKRVLITRRGFKTKKEAQSKLNELKYEFDKGILTSSSSLTYREAYESWIKLYADTVKESTLNKTESYFKNHILKRLGHIQLKNITPKDCQALANYLAGIYKGYKKIYNYAKSVFDYAYKTGLINSMNPFDRVILPKQEKKKEETPFLEMEELKEVLSYMKSTPKWYAFFRLLAFTGMRRGEALALNWKDIDFSGLTIRINKTVTTGLNNLQYISSTKTVSGVRTISVDLETLKVLSDYKRTLKKDFDLVFPNRNGDIMRLGKPYQFLQRTIKANNLKEITVHSFRHTHCSMLFAAGWNLKEVMDRLGWSDTKTCLGVYYHVTEVQKKKSMDSFLNFVKENS